MPRTRLRHIIRTLFDRGLRIAIPIGLLLGLVASGVPSSSHAGSIGQKAHGLTSRWVEPAATELLQSEIQSLRQVTGSDWRLQLDPLRRIARQGMHGSMHLQGSLAIDQIRQQADTFLQTHATLLGASGAELLEARSRRSGRTWHLSLQQSIDFKPLLGARIDLVVGRGGGVGYFRSTLVPHPRSRIRSVHQGIHKGDLLADLQRFLGPGATLQVEENRSVFFLDIDFDRIDIRAGQLLIARSAFGGRWKALFDDETRELLEVENLVRTEQLTGTTTGTYLERSYRDRPVAGIFPWLRVQLGPEETDPYTHSDRFGDFSFVLESGTFTLHAPLAGLYARIDNASASDDSPYFNGDVSVPGEVSVFFGGVAARADERTVYFHINRIHDYFKDNYQFDLLDFPLAAVVEAADPGTGDPNYPNAFWNGEFIGFGNGGRIYQAFSYYADVIYHEYAHAVTDHLYRPFDLSAEGEGGAIHEALSDYFAATLQDDPVIGEDMGRQIQVPPFRHLQNNLTWPESRDERDEVHANGEILAGAFWDLRQLTGPEVADALIHYARDLLPRTFDEYLTAIQLQDEWLFGDGLPGNGTPHAGEIATAFGLHGWGSLSQRTLRVVHQPLADTDDEEAPRIIQAEIDAFYPDQGFMSLFYRLRGSGADFEQERMEATAEGVFKAEIPAHPMGSEVEYFLGAALLQPLVLGSLPGDAPFNTFTYRVQPAIEAPRIQHEDVEGVAAFAWPPQIMSHIQDGHGVRGAWLEYRLNGGDIWHSGLVRDRHDPEIFRGSFTSARALEGDLLEYRIVAMEDSREARTSTHPETGFAAVRIARQLAHDFTTGGRHWQHDPAHFGKADAWQLTDSMNRGAPGGDAWLCGDSDSDYPPGVSAALVTDWYRLGEQGRASFWSWIEAASIGGLAHDGGRVELRTSETAEWQLLYPVSGYSHQVHQGAIHNALLPGSPCLSGHSTAWQEYVFDLSAFASQRVQLRFLFASDETAGPGEGRGWFVDDFSVDPGDAVITDAYLPVSRGLGLQAPFPNPFNPQVTLRLHAERPQPDVQVRILDARGQLVRWLHRGPLPTGANVFVWDGRTASGLASGSGVYYYLVESDLGRRSGKMVLVR